MTRRFTELLEEASKLPENERAELAGLLIESLESAEDESAKTQWLAEIEKRIADVELGRVKTIPWSLARAKLFSSDEPAG